MECGEQHRMCTNCKDYGDSCTYPQFCGRKNATNAGETALTPRAFAGNKNCSSEVTTTSSRSTDSAKTATTSRELASFEARISTFSSERSHGIATSPGDPKIYSVTDMQLLHHY